MSKEDFDIFRHLAKDPKANNAVKLIKGLQNREIGALRKTENKEQLQIFAEEELVRKEDLKEMRCQMPGIPRSTFLMVFSPDGQRAASTHSNHNIYVTDLRTGKNIKTLVGHPRTPWCIAFHPTSNQIVASGCLGGQVRIWDLSGGSEVWTTATQSVIASIAFHPSDRVLVIATFNEVYFWDWSLPEPLVHVSTNSPKEKVRYVAFDKLGHKLITGVANSPQTRWERVRAPVVVPRQERCASPYRRRITQRLVTSAGNAPNPPSYPEYSAPQNNTPAVVPERERRITMCYQNLVREYELLVHRYLQLHRAPTMIDRGTDPMEPNHYNSGTQTAGSREQDPSLPGPSGLQSPPNSTSMGSDTILEPSASARTTINTTDPCEPQPSTSQSQNLITPSRIFSVCRKPPSSIRGTQTVESRKHKFDGGELNRNKEKRLKRNSCDNTSSESDSSREPQPQEQTQVESTFPDLNSSNIREGQRVLVVNLERLRPESEIQNNSSMSASNAQTPHQSSSTGSEISQGFPPGFIIDDVIPPGQPTAAGSPGNRYSERFNEYIRTNRARIQEFRRRTLDRGSSSIAPSTSANTDGDVQAPSSVSNDNGTATNGAVDELIHNIRRTAEYEVRNRILPIITSIPPPDRPELIRLFENSREHVRLRFRQMFPAFLRRHARRSMRVRIGSSTDSSSSDNEVGRHSPSNANHLNSEASEFPTRIEDPNITTDNTAAPQSTDNATSHSSTSSATLPPRLERNFNTELEQLVTSLLTEIERSDSRSANNTPATSNSTTCDINNNYSQSTSARTRPTHPHLWPGSGVTIPQPPGESIENMFQSDSVRESESERSSRSRWTQDMPNASGGTSHFGYRRPSHHDPRGSPFSNSDTRTTSSPMYTTAGLRRRFFSHRVSAFMPTRVNYSRMRCRRNPHYAVGSGRSGIPRANRSPTIVLDELINYAEREQSEEDASTAAQQPFEQPDDGQNGLGQLQALGPMISNIVQDLESSLDDVRNIRANNISGSRPGMLSSFSQRMDNIMANSENMLRNMRSFDRLPSGPTESARSTTENEPRWNFNDPGFYVRDLRTEASNNMETEGTTSPGNMQDMFGYMHAVTTDHTYPRNPNRTGAIDRVPPLFNSLQFTVSYINSQSRLLRRRVESIERIDRAMVEVGQLQLMRNLVAEMVRHIRSSAVESRSAGVSSVRQMMAGTRISDTSPTESPNEDGGNMGNQTRPQPEVENPQPGPSSSTDQPGPTAGTSTGTSRRSMNRKTYPPSRYVRLPRSSPRRSLVNWFARYAPSRGERGNRQSRSGSARPPPVPTSNIGSHNVFNYTTISPSTLTLMTRRLERLLTEQMRVLTRTQDPPSSPSCQSNVTVDLGEHILALRLHGCFMRMHRVLGSNMNPSLLRCLTSDRRGAAVTQDGAVRYSVRHTLSLIVDGMSRYIEELGNGTISNSMRLQIHAVLAMSVLLAEVVLLQVVDSIPAFPGTNMNAMQSALTGTADGTYLRLFNNRHAVPGGYIIARSLKLMRLAIRYANRALDETYRLRRNVLIPRHDIDRRILFGTINTCLRIIKRIQTRNVTHPVSEATAENSSTPAGSSDNSSERTAADLYSETFYSTIHSLIARYSDSREEDVPSQPSGPRDRAESTNDLSSNNENSDDDADDPEEPDWFYQRHSSNPNGSNNSRHLYRTNNVNLAPQPSIILPRASVRFWNVPSVQVNDVPVSEPSVFSVHRLMAHRRFAERVSELRYSSAQRANPRVGLFRPRFLHPLYASLNPFDADLDDPQRDQIYDSDMIATVTPNHRIQVWDISNGQIPGISNSLKNVVVSECKIHNDASVDIATDGTILVTLLPSGGYLNVTNRLGVYSLRWETLGQCLYTTSFEQNAVSVALSPLSRHLVVGFASRRVSIVPTDRWVMARIYKIEQKDVPGDRLPVLRELDQHRENRINCIRWLPSSGQGLIYATNTGQLVILS
uniref:Activating molecule in BECN1-regulated autophagy protein 1 n=1 Tax=Dendroctonus ponderosae TaxID=77166 RepID=A0AAR5Q292_DENPD